ncbi:Glu-tRNA(Gln) amidotransferase GatDE subunit E [Candidatus Bathyarchaeota archaeon]|nr:MAG: Glu-tRNA(Gln) amidotransferase GatDE subunit E [Candidatus Bathyarchaeota archaeon]
MDYGKLGLKVGLEVHQELDTRQKLFCACPPKLFREEPEYTFVRRLRPSQSELGEVDPAALFEFMQGKTIVYEANRETSCLVEMDEEPPGPLNGEALDICLTFALMVGSRPVDEVHVMRKTVVDGSNTTGFQRTCVVSLGGSVEVGGRPYRLQQVCLEEDAARKIAEEGQVSRYRIDRLGIPLIEVTTAPDIRSPKEAEEVALAIGRILRATGRVRRGLGTIRQDLNVSIEGGALIEIKGVQDLALISKVVEYEAMRQARLLDIVSELRARGVEPSDLAEEYVDVSEVFASTRCRIIRGALKRGQRVYALRLPGFAGLVGRELCPNRRLGTEMADRARFWGGVRGLFHTDELPGYDISAEEVRALRERVGASEGDAVVVVADEAGRCRRALSAVLDRAREALVGVPSETRAADADGTTHYTRPRPGAARMYPETDVVAISITPDRLERLRAALPEMPEAKLRRLRSEYGLNEKLARQVVDSDYGVLFEELAKETGASPTLIAVTLTETFRSLERDGVQVGSLSDEAIRGAFRLLDEGLAVKESLPEIFTWLAAHPEASPRDAVRALGLELLPRDELRRLVEAKVREKMELVERMGERALGPLMGAVMSEVRGRARAGDVQALLREVLRTALSSLSGE